MSAQAKAAEKPKKPQTGLAPARQDEHRVMALDLPQGELSPAMQAYFAKCDEKIGFVPNVLKAYAHDTGKLEAFAGFYNDLMLGASGLSKLEREMIAVVVSSQNRCYYCLTAHGAAVRQMSGDPALGELMVMNYRAAELAPRHRAMLDFAVGSPTRPGPSRRRTGRPCGMRASATGTSGTLPRSRASSTCRTGWRPPSICGRTPNTTGRRDRNWCKRKGRLGRRPCALDV
jgi:uncharacterized peroxidase-related enzyme